MSDQIIYLNLFFTGLLFLLSTFKKVFRLPFFLITFNYLIFDFLSTLTAKNGIHNHIYANIYDIIDLFLLTILMVGFIRRFSISKNLIKKDIFIGLLTCCSVLPLFFFDSIMVLNPYLGFIKSIIVSALVFYYLFKTIKYDSVILPAIKDYRIVIPFSILFLNTTGAFITLFTVYLIYNDRLYDIFININLTIYLIYKFFLIFGLWLMKKQP